MDKVVAIFIFSAIITVSLTAKRTINGVPVLVNEYMYEIPVHHTPLRVKYPEPYPYALYADEELVDPQVVYGLPNVVEIIVPKAVLQQPQEVRPASASAEDNSIRPESVKDGLSAGPGEEIEPVVSNYKFDLPSAPYPPALVKPAPVYDVPEVVVAKAEPAIANTAPVAEIVVTKAQPASEKPVLVVEVPEVVVKAEPAPEKSAVADVVPEVVVVTAEPAARKPALVYGVPDVAPPEVN